MKNPRLAMIASTAGVAAVLCTLSFAARADDDTSRPLTREEVVAQVLAARQSGELAVLETGGTWTPPQQPAATASRDDVVANVLSARQSGELAVLETGGTWSREAEAPAPVSREQVINEFLKTRQVSDALAMEHSL